MQLFLGSDQPSNIALVAGATKHSQHTFWHSISVEILNPKTAIFYIAFLPQFTDPAAALPITAQLLILGAIVNVMFSSADVLCVLMASVVVKFFANSPAGNRILQRVGGGVLVALGLHLGFSRD